MKERRERRRLLRAVLLAAVLAMVPWAGWAQGNPAKIDPELQEQMHQSRDASERFRVIIEMAEQYDNPNLERGTAMMTRAQRRDYVVDELKRFSERSQAEVVGYLAAQGTRGQVNVLHRFWIFNGLCCEATADCIEELSMRSDVRFVALDKEMDLIEPEEEVENRDNPPEGIQWHVSKVRADEVWTYNGTSGYTGNGVVVAIIDSGVNYNHVDLSNMWDGGEQYPNHGWDFYNDDNDPMDDNGHGSHVAGIVASRGETYKAGIAPDASIMALKVSDESGSGIATMMVCTAVEFAVEHGADILNVSLGRAKVGGVAMYRDTFVNVLNAGIVAAVAAGNEGSIFSPNYSSAPYNISAPGNCPPPWLNPAQSNVLSGGNSAVICVGNVKSNDKRKSTSSFGPVTWTEGSEIWPYYDYPYESGSSTNIGLIRPDISAPGTDIWSLKKSDNVGYWKSSGTSMAAPCVAGVIALMLEANPFLTPAKIDEILETTAVPCENQTGKNNYYGAGRVDAYAAVTAARNENMPHRYRVSVSKYPYDCECSNVSGAGIYNYGEQCTLQASPSEGSFFVGWLKNGIIVETEASFSFDVTENVQYTAVFEEDVACHFISLYPNHVGAAVLSGNGHYYSGQSCTLVANTNEGYVFSHYSKDGEIVSTNPEYTFTVTEDATYIANFRRYCEITTTAFPVSGGIVSGADSYLTGDPCTVTATPNLGFAFLGWYNNELGSILYSRQPEYTFTVTNDRTLVARFAPMNYTITTTASPSGGGSVSGGGTYPAETVVTVSAHANTGYRFNGWMENGEVVAVANNYTFYARVNRDLTASFVSTDFDIGSVVTNPDGSQGVVFHLNPNGTEGWMVALNDASEGCAWGEATNVLALQEVPFNSPLALEDLSGYRNTGILRTLQGTESEYAAATVDYDNGWYLPSSGQLRKLYSALPFIEEAITAAGGTTLTEGTYWSSSEYSASDAFVPSFAMSNTGKTATCRVRAIRNFVTAGNNAVVVTSNDNQMGMASVSGNGTFAYGATATVTATPNAGYAFDHWSEDGVAVSYDAVYQFTFTRSRSLVAHFTVPGSVGSIVVNADGSKGVVFWLDPDGDQGLMVALDDASEGCAWGEATDALTLLNKPFNSPLALEDVSGNTNTRCIRKHQGTENEYAASLVDFENGWYLPSVGELRKLYAALPMVEPALSVAGGNTLTEDTYWSSTEYSATDAATATFSMGNTGKTGTCRVRAIRHFATASPNAVTAKPDNLAFGTVTGSGEYTTGQTVTVTAMPNTGYAFNAWTENGMIVSLNPTYQFSFTRSRCLEAHFVVPGSVGSIVTNSDGSRGVVFYTDPSGISGWMVALEDDSEGCAWGNAGEDVLALDNLNPSQTIELLTDMDGRRNSRIMRGWFVGQTGYAANEVDYNNQWFLPTAGQLRKLYAALPMVEPNLVNAEGSLLTDDAYWSSTERSANEAWSPSFAFGSSNKGENRRVRAIRSFYTANVQHPHVFVGTNGTLWSDPTNWINPSRNLLDNDDDVIITTQCVVDEDATVSSLTMAYGSTISVDEGRRLAVTEDIHNTYDTRINLGLGSQLVNPTEGTYFSMSKEIEGYGDSEDGGWYTIATPLKDGMGLGTLTAGTYDLYVYDEPTHYWLNQKVENNNITTLQNGLGYLYAHQVATTLNFTGQAKSSSDEYLWSVSNTATSAPLNGFNLLGNPFTSDIAIGHLRANGAALSAYYKVSNGNSLVAYTDADNEPIRPAEGFFVQAQAGNVSFNTATRGTAANGYVRLVLTENGKMLDRAYLKVTEGGGLPKLRMNEGASELYFRQEDIDFAVAERREDVMEYPLYFKALHNGSYTIAADLLNTDCDYLHLIDNLTGADVNLLTSQSTEDCGTESAMTAGRMSYTFTAKTTDYASRFRLVFSGSADGPSADGQPIAYYADGEIRLLADARGASLQVMDMLGRVVRVFTDAARNISTTGMPAGVYVLRLISGDNVKTQKVIVN